MRILLVEDDRELSSRLAATISEAGFIPEICDNGATAEFLGATESYDAAVVDLGLPGLDGVSLIQRWREQGVRFPILILTARNRWSDKVAGFGAGADDYVTKPFQIEEVVLRLHALLRRASGHADSVLQVGALTYDSRSGRFHIQGNPLNLTAQEQRILVYLMHNAGRLISRSDIAEHVYHRDLEPDSNTLDVLVGRIRKKLGVPMITTERGLGFRLDAVEV